MDKELYEDDSKPYLYNGDVVLPHQCNEWFIGGRKDVETMIALLQKLLNDPSLNP